MGGGSSAPAEPSTTTQIQDIPAWEQGYVTDLLGQAQTEAAQPYQQFPGQQVAGFTPDQTQSFSNVEGQGAANASNQAAAMSQANAGSNTANNIFGSGAGDINAATSYNPLAAVSPYLGAASQYNAATAAQPGINQSTMYNAAAAGAASPLGIQQYMSPYTNSVVSGLENTANQNWNQNIMPGVNNEFVGSGQYGSGRNAQVLGQAANEEQTNLDTSVANALQSGYTTAGNQAATEAGILGNSANTALSGANAASNAQTSQIGNLINQGNTAGTATQQQAANLNTAGVNLGNLASTQATQQLNAGTTLGALGAQDANTNLQQNQALNAVGLQQQQQNQTNLNVAQTNWANQTQYPEQQTQFENQIIRGLPAPTASTSAGEVTAPTVSPLQSLGGAGLAGLALQGSNGNTVGQVVKRGGLIKGKKKGGMIKGYANGGSVDDEDDNIGTANLNPLMMQNMANNYYGDDDAKADTTLTADLPTAPASPLASNDDDTQQENTAPPESDENAANQTSDSDSSPPDPNIAGTSPVSPLNNDDEQPDTDSEHGNAAPASAPQGFTPQMMQQQQLLALARGMLTPNIGGNVGVAFGQGLGNMQDVTEKYQSLMAQQNSLAYQRQQDAKKLDIEQQKADAMSQKAGTDATYKGGGAGANKIVQVMGPDGKPIYTTAKDAMDKGLTTASGFKPSTLSPQAIDMYADAIANGAKGSDLGLGYGMNGDKKAVLDKVAEKYPNLDLAGAQTQLIGDRAGARKVGSTIGGVEYASESLGGMIPLAKEGYAGLDRTQYPNINAIENAVAKGTGDTKIIALNNYINAIKADQALLFTKGGDSTDKARDKTDAAVSTAFTSGQFNAYADSLQNEIKIQKTAGKAAMNSFKSSNGAAAQPTNNDALAAKRAAVLAARAAQGGQ